MVVPELPPDIAELKERVGRFVADEVFPLEETIAAAGEIDFAAVDAVRKKARAAGFSMLNMPEEAGGAGLSMLGQVALEEESGKATNGLGFAVVDRGPAELWEILTPEQRDRWVVPILRGEYREAWAVTEPGAGSDVSAVAATAVRDGDEWVLNGEKWFVTSEGDPGFYIVLAVVDGEQTLFIVEPGTPGLELTRVPGFLHDPYLDHHPELVLRDCRVPDENRVPAGGNEGRKGMVPRRAALHRSALLRRLGARARHRARLGARARRLREADRRARRGFVPARRLPHRPPRRAAPHLPRRPRVRRLRGPQGRPREGGRSEALRVRGGWADRRPLAPDPRRPRLHDREPGARFWREVRVDRIWEGTSEIQRLILARGLLKRGVEPYVD